MRVLSRPFFAPLLLLGMTVGCSTTGTSRVDQWAVKQGGCVEGAAACSARAALSRLHRPELPLLQHLTIEVLEADRPAAYAWPCGRIFVSRGLVDLLTADELTAAIAHEVGHLMAEPSPENGVALAGDHSHDACEIAADEAGRRLLAASGVPESSLVSMLEKIATDTRTSAQIRPLLLQRAALLSHGR